LLRQSQYEAMTESNRSQGQGRQSARIILAIRAA
jgi:hypothetical protein